MLPVLTQVEYFEYISDLIHTVKLVDLKRKFRKLVDIPVKKTDLGFQKLPKSALSKNG
jgi:hypothetical protein